MLKKRLSGLGGVVFLGLVVWGCGATPPEPTPTPAARTPIAQPSATTTPGREASPTGPSSMDRYLEQRKKNNQPKGRTDPIR